MEGSRGTSRATSRGSKNSVDKSFIAIVKKIGRERTLQEIEVMMDWVKNSNIDCFQDLNDSILFRLCEVMEYMSFEERHIIYKQGDVALHGFVLLSGTMSTWKSPKYSRNTQDVSDPQKRYHNGNIQENAECLTTVSAQSLKDLDFGKVCLTNPSKRPPPRRLDSACTETACEIMRLRRSDLASCFKHPPDTIVDDTARELSRFECLENVGFTQLRKLGMISEPLTVMQGSVVQEQAGPPVFIYFIMRGDFQMFYLPSVRDKAKKDREKILALEGETATKGLTNGQGEEEQDVEDKGRGRLTDGNGESNGNGGGGNIGYSNGHGGGGGRGLGGVTPEPPELEGDSGRRMLLANRVNPEARSEMLNVIHLGPGRFFGDVATFGVTEENPLGVIAKTYADVIRIPSSEILKHVRNEVMDLSRGKIMAKHTWRMQRVHDLLAPERAKAAGEKILSEKLGLTDERTLHSMVPQKLSLIQRKRRSSATHALLTQRAGSTLRELPPPPPEYPASHKQDGDTRRKNQFANTLPASLDPPKGSATAAAREFLRSQAEKRAAQARAAQAQGSQTERKPKWRRKVLGCPASEDYSLLSEGYNSQLNNHKESKVVIMDPQSITLRKIQPALMFPEYIDDTLNQLNAKFSNYTPRPRPPRLRGHLPRRGNDEDERVRSAPNESHAEAQRWEPHRATWHRTAISNSKPPPPAGLRHNGHSTDLRDTATHRRSPRHPKFVPHMVSELKVADTDSIVEDVAVREKENSTKLRYVKASDLVDTQPLPEHRSKTPLTHTIDNPHGSPHIVARHPPTSMRFRPLPPTPRTPTKITRAPVPRTNPVGISRASAPVIPAPAPRTKVGHEHVSHVALGFDGQGHDYIAEMGLAGNQKTSKLHHWANRSLHDRLVESVAHLRERERERELEVAGDNVKDTAQKTAPKRSPRKSKKTDKNKQMLMQRFWSNGFPGRGAR